jgi:riboflavin biosynthesis pyrimidine reductase
MIGRRGAGKVPITGEVTAPQVHLMRAEADAILSASAPRWPTIPN